LGQRAGLEAIDPAGIVDSQNVVIGNGLRYDEIGRFSEPLFE
jgi:hypothetical protein